MAWLEQGYREAVSTYPLPAHVLATLQGLLFLLPLTGSAFHTSPGSYLIASPWHVCILMYTVAS